MLVYTKMRILVFDNITEGVHAFNQAKPTKNTRFLKRLTKHTEVCLLQLTSVYFVKRLYKKTSVYFVNRFKNIVLFKNNTVHDSVSNGLRLIQNTTCDY